MPSLGVPARLLVNIVVEKTVVLLPTGLVTNAPICYTDPINCCSESSFIQTECCPDVPTPSTLYVTNANVEGCECADVETTTLVYTPSVEVPSYGAHAAWFGTRTWQCNDVVLNYYLLCDTTADPDTWVLILEFNGEDAGPTVAQSTECDPFLSVHGIDLSSLGDMQDCTEPATVSFVVSEISP